MTHKGRGRNIRGVMAEINRFTRGWMGYFRLSTVQAPFDMGVALLEQRYCIGKTRGSGKLRFPRRVALGETGGEANH